MLIWLWGEGPRLGPLERHAHGMTLTFIIYVEVWGYAGGLRIIYLFFNIFSHYFSLSIYHYNKNSILVRLHKLDMQQKRAHTSWSMVWPTTKNQEELQPSAAGRTIVVSPKNFPVSSYVAMKSRESYILEEYKGDQSRRCSQKTLSPLSLPVQNHKRQDFRRPCTVVGMMEEAEAA